MYLLLNSFVVKFKETNPTVSQYLPLCKPVALLSNTVKSLICECPPKYWIKVSGNQRLEKKRQCQNTSLLILSGEISELVPKRNKSVIVQKIFNVRGNVSLAKMLHSDFILQSGIVFIVELMVANSDQIIINRVEDPSRDQSIRNSGVTQPIPIMLITRVNNQQIHIVHPSVGFEMLC
ncbi:hypothetical protein WICPIJ_004670 [Wickerhamomyces pijperi]|uniref:Uncharacterized protein n=1 Tax=Wickerhamomyces pijperi TaxID=599730 RepID=A0A9P8TMJ6_WICPI|nr:hypothetical protein WICPIJ_004670 [Wickerhamomyces pijperi]